MPFKYEKLRVWKLSIKLLDLIYELGSALPEEERFNLYSQIIRAATSISLNIAEGSTSQTDNEQHRFIKYAIRSLIEVDACIKIILRRRYIGFETDLVKDIEFISNQLFRGLQAFSRSLK